MRPPARARTAVARGSNWIARGAKTIAIRSVSWPAGGRCPGSIAEYVSSDPQPDLVLARLWEWSGDLVMHNARLRIGQKALLGLVAVQLRALAAQRGGKRAPIA
jgi:hypothetical protein